MWTEGRRRGRVGCSDRPCVAEEEKGKWRRGRGRAFACKQGATCSDLALRTRAEHLKQLKKDKNSSFFHLKGSLAYKCIFGPSGSSQKRFVLFEFWVDPVRLNFGPCRVGPWVCRRAAVGPRLGP
jgi:hypothetical protein